MAAAVPGYRLRLATVVDDSISPSVICHRVRSSRPASSMSNLTATSAVIWLMRTLKPDFKTIADIRAVNRTSVRVCLVSSSYCARGSISISRVLLALWMSRKQSRRSTTKHRAISPATRYETFSYQGRRRALPEEHIIAAQSLHEGRLYRKRQRTASRVKNARRAESANALRARSERCSCCSCFRRCRCRHSFGIKSTRRLHSSTVSRNHRMSDEESGIRGAYASSRGMAIIARKWHFDAKNTLIVEQAVTDQRSMGLLKPTFEPVLRNPRCRR